MAESVPFDRIAPSYELTRGGLERGLQFATSVDRYLTRRSTVVEIGVGTAAVASPLRDLGHRVIGVDLSRPMLNLAAGRLPGLLVEGDAAVLPVRGSAVDAVLAVWAVHVVGDFDALVREVRRVLDRAGRWFVVSPTPDFVPVDVLDIAHRFGPALGRGWDRAEHLAPRLEPLGFELVDDFAADEHVFEESPSTRADAIEGRVWSSLWDLDQATWAQHIQPVVDDLRALPEPDRPRACVQRHRMSVYQVVAQ